MPTYLTDDALCLRVTDFSETSQIVQLLTRDHGLLPLIAKGSKRQTKKNTMSGPLDLLTAGEVVFIPAKTLPGASELGTLHAWELTDHRTTLRANLPAWSAAMLAVEMTTALLHPHDPHAELFDQLEAALQLLPTPQRPRAIVAYAKAALSSAGYAPHLSHCITCNKPFTADGTLHFSPAAGGISCCRAQGNTLAIPARIIIALDRLPFPATLLQNPPDRPADAAALQSALQLLLAQIEFITNKPLKTRPMISAIF